MPTVFSIRIHKIARREPTGHTGSRCLIFFRVGPLPKRCRREGLGGLCVSVSLGGRIHCVLLGGLRLVCPYLGWRNNSATSSTYRMNACGLHPIRVSRIEPEGEAQPSYIRGRIPQLPHSFCVGREASVRSKPTESGDLRSPGGRL